MTRETFIRRKPMSKPEADGGVAIESTPLLGMYPRYDAATVTRWHKDHKTNSTGFLGVLFRRKRGVYEARIRVHGRKEKIHIGTAATAEEAARMYDAKARELYGPGAVVNFDMPNSLLDRTDPSNTQEAKCNTKT